jgi:uncharacterized protein (DUF2336 family)
VKSITELFQRKQADELPVPLDDMDYEEQKRRAQDPDAEVRAALASRTDTAPEILYYLASDPALSVRQAVAANPATPVQADDLLCQDLSDEVRQDLALKVARIIPNMAEDELEKIRDMTVRILYRLAQDQLVRVRAILAEELKLTLKAPKQVIRLLAQDVEMIVAAPILEYSPLLDDHDFREIIAAGCASEVLSAISRRRTISAELAEEIVATLDVPAVAALLTNPSATIRESTLEEISTHAESIVEWHEPLVARPELSIRAMRRIANFVASSLVERLSERRGLPAAVADELRAAVRRRLDQTTGGIADEVREQVVEQDVHGVLDDDALVEAINAGRRDFVVEALVLRADLKRTSVEKLLRTQSPKTITALAWRAGLSMRMAMRLQSQVAGIPPQKMLNARNGTDYPLSEKEMTWQIEALV